MPQLIRINKDLGYGKIPKGTLLIVDEFCEDKAVVIDKKSPFRAHIIHISHYEVISKIADTAQQIIDGICDIYESWNKEPLTSDFAAEVRDLATRIYNHVVQELEKQRG